MNDPVGFKTFLGIKGLLFNSKQLYITDVFLDIHMFEILSIECYEILRKLRSLFSRSA